MLRGNHETRTINSVYGFSADLRERFGPDDGAKLWETFNQMFDNMPLAALIDKQIFCMHGGFGPTLDDFDAIRKVGSPQLTCH